MALGEYKLYASQKECIRVSLKMGYTSHDYPYFPYSMAISWAYSYSIICQYIPFPDMQLAMLGESLDIACQLWRFFPVKAPFSGGFFHGFPMAFPMDFFVPRLFGELILTLKSIRSKANRPIPLSPAVLEELVQVGTGRIRRKWMENRE